MLTTHIENRIIVYKSFCSLRMRQLTIDFELADSSVYNDANSISKSMTRIHQQVNDANSSASQWREFISKPMTFQCQSKQTIKCWNYIKKISSAEKNIFAFPCTIQKPMKSMTPKRLFYSMNHTFSCFLTVKTETLHLHNFIDL